MAEVYSSTTAPNPKASWFVVPSQYLDKTRFIVKISEVVLSFLAFVLEEAVSTCSSCSSLYFFEFVSCSSFLFTSLLLILLSTNLHRRVGVSAWTHLDFIYSSVIALLFLVSSAMFASNNNGTGLEVAAVVFGFSSMLAFLLDVFLSWRSFGVPFVGNRKSDVGNGAAAVEAPAERERLKDGAANGAE